MSDNPENLIKTKVRTKIDSKDVEGPRESSIDLPIGASMADVDRSDLKLPEGLDIQSAAGQDYMRDLRFFEEKVTFMASEVTDPNAENPIPIGVNCEERYIERGKEYTLPRKFLNVLICREDKIMTVKAINEKDGTDYTVIKRVPSLKYPVHVLHDPSGSLGAQWFQWKCKNVV